MLITLSGKCPYPVGHYIFTDDSNFNPNTFYSGTTWEQVKGRTLVGVDESQSEFNTVKKTGGEKTHKLTIDEMPSHSHKWKGYLGNRQNLSGGAYSYAIAGSDVIPNDPITSTGNGTSHNNLQPYKTTYIWTRTK